VLLGQLALHIGDDVHHLAVTLDEELIGDLDGCRSAPPRPTVVAAEVEQHQVARPRSLGSARSSTSSALSSCGLGPRGRVPAIGRMVTRAARQP